MVIHFINAHFFNRFFVITDQDYFDKLSNRMFIVH